MNNRYLRLLTLQLVGILLCVTHSNAQYFSKRIDYYGLNTGAASFTFVNDTFYFPVAISYTGGNLLGKVAANGTEVHTPLLHSAPGNGNILYPITYYNNSLYASGGGGYTIPYKPLL